MRLLEDRREERLLLEEGLPEAMEEGWLRLQQQLWLQLLEERLWRTQEGLPLKLHREGSSLQER